MVLLFKLWFLVICIGVIAYLAWKKPAILPALLAGAVAFDISTTWLPPIAPMGSPDSLSLARLFTVGVIGAALWRLWKEPELRRHLKVILKHFLSKGLLIYIAVGAFSFIYSIGRAKTVVEVLRLLVFFFLYLAIGLLVERRHVLLPFKVVHWVGVALVPLTIYEGATRHFIWRGYLAEGMIARVNATFVDPNIFARYLVLAVVANLILQYLNTDPKKRYIYFGALLGLLAALAVTLSRSGVVTLIAVLVLLCLLIPRKRMVQPIAVLGLIGAVIVASRPTVWHRLLTFRKGLGALDAQRAYLWRVSWAMFRDHPLFGVGLGGFQKSFLTHYISYKTAIPYVKGVTLSHTTILTIAAELGLVGLAALALVWVAVIWTLRELRGSKFEMTGTGNPLPVNEPEKVNAAEVENDKTSQGSSRGKKNISTGYLVGVGYFLWVVAVFISSQSEARFFEDPMIWIGMGMMIHLVIGEMGSDDKREFNSAAD